MSLKSTVLAALIIVPMSSAAALADVVVDGGFESDATGNYSATSYFFHLGPNTFGPWTVNSGFVYVNGFSSEAHSGNNSLNLAPGNPAFPSDITQTLSTVAGQLYDLSFYAAAGGVNTFTVKFDGMVIDGSPTSLPSTLPNGSSDYSAAFIKYDYLVTAATNQSILEFGGTATDNPGNGPSAIVLDDISVNAIAVPEPLTASLFGAGLIAAATFRRRRRKANAA